MAQVWMDYTIDTAINIAHQKQITVPDNIEPYMDDILCSITSRQYIRSGLRSNSNKLFSSTCTTWLCPAAAAAIIAVEPVESSACRHIK